MMRGARSFAAELRAMFWGVALWAVHFGVVYGYTGLACARRFEASGATWVALVPWVVGGATLAAAGLGVALVARRGRGPGFGRWIGSGAGALAVVAIVLEGAAAIWVPSCG